MRSVGENEWSIAAYARVLPPGILIRRHRRANEGDAQSAPEISKKMFRQIEPTKDQPDSLNHFHPPLLP